MPASLSPKMPPDALTMPSVKRWRANISPAIRHRINICIHCFRPRNWLRCNFRLRLHYHFVISCTTIWHPLPVLVSLPLIIMPKNCRLKNGRVPTCRVRTRNKTASHHRDSDRNNSAQPAPFSLQPQFFIHTPIIPYPQPTDRRLACEFSSVLLRTLEFSLHNPASWHSCQFVKFVSLLCIPQTALAQQHVRRPPGPLIPLHRVHRACPPERFGEGGSLRYSVIALISCFIRLTHLI